MDANPDNVPFDEFVKLLRHALHHLYDPDWLRSSQLAVLCNVAGRFDTPSALQRILIDAIASLQPSSSEPPQSRAWRIYDALYYRYVRQQEREDVADQLGISGRQLRREQHTAIEVLADVLWREYKVRPILPVQLITDAQEKPAADTELVDDQDFAWIRETLPDRSTEIQPAINEVIQLTERMAQAMGAQVDVFLAAHLPYLAVPPVAFRQILLSLLAVAIPHALKGRILLSAVLEDFSGKFTIICSQPTSTPMAIENDHETQNIEMAKRLVRMCDGSLEVSTRQQVFQIELNLPVVGHLPVLVVDDNPDALQLYQRYVAGTSYWVTGTSEPKEVMNLARKIAAKVIVLDVMMPEVDGWEILGRLRQETTTSQIPIIVCSILPQEPLARSLGANAFLRKPVSRLEFLQALDTISPAR